MLPWYRWHFLSIAVALPDRRLASSLIWLPLILLGCRGSQMSESEPVYSELPEVGEVELTVARRTPEHYQLLNIGIATFANHHDENESETYGEWVFSEIRDNERYFLPFQLRQTLQESEQWGAIRVLPLNDPSADLSIEGQILQSDGARLVLEIRATDSTGRIWLDDIYVDGSSEADYPDSTRLRSASQLQAEDIREPFEDIYQQISNDLLAMRHAMSEQQLTNIRQVSSMIYANDLSPESFGHTLLRDGDGRWQVAGLPAGYDPMAQRVEEMRLRHLLFIDTVDDYYRALFDAMEASYLVWRRYSFDQIEGLDTPSPQPRDRGLFGSRNDTLSIIQRYNRFRWSKIYEQEFVELAAGFNRELAPAILELNKNVHGLSGTMEEQYIQWRRILRQLFALEIEEV